MSTGKIEKMREARESPVVILQEYNTFRSNCAKALVCCFEGFDDVSFYSVVFRMVRPTLLFKPFVCKGKGRVLKLRDILSRNQTHVSDLNVFFIDKDFDGLRGYASGDDLYCTETYSFENLLVTENVLERLLITEFRCVNEDASDIPVIMDLFRKRYDEFVLAMRIANAILFFCRKNQVATKGLENKIERYVKVSLSSVTSLACFDATVLLLGIKSDANRDGKIPVTEQAVESTKEEFELIPPYTGWRGKFAYGFFIKFLSALKEDRGGACPTYFSQRAKMQFDPRGNIISALATSINIPDSLRNFITKIKEPICFQP